MTNNIFALFSRFENRRNSTPADTETPGTVDKNNPLFQADSKVQDSSKFSQSGKHLWHLNE